MALAAPQLIYSSAGASISHTSRATFSPSSGTVKLVHVAYKEGGQ